MIQLEHLTKDYGGGRGLFDVSFDVREGEVFGFLGPNGAGKTTAIRQLMGFIRPDSGTCHIGGMDCWLKSSGIHRELGYLPGEIALPDTMTGLKFLRFTAELRGLKNFERASRLMDQLELDASGQLKKMSKGMKQKIGIVSAFMHDPKVLILDEPTSGLDPLMQNQFIKLILEEKQRGKTILMSSHMFEEVERTCDRIGILRAGRLVAAERTALLRQNKSKRFVLTFASGSDAQAFAGEPLCIQAVEGRRVTVAVQGDASGLTRAMRGYAVTDMDVLSQSLEELFLPYYGGEAHAE